VLANRANELLGAKRGDYKPVHPNDHVTWPVHQRRDSHRHPARRAVAAGALGSRSRVSRVPPREGQGVRHIVKSGRTHLQDATPIRLGQEFTGVGTPSSATATAYRAATILRDLGIGGTAVGTGLNAEPQTPR